MLRNTLIYPLLSEPAAIKAGGLTVNYLEKTDDFKSTGEEIRAELKKMKVSGLVISKSGGKWALTDNGLAAAMSQELDSKVNEKPHFTTTPPTVTPLDAPELQDLTALLAGLSGLTDINQLKEKIEVISQLYKWLHPTIGDIFEKIIDDLENLQEIATLAQKCLVNKN